MGGIGLRVLKQPIVGLDIGSANIKIVEMKEAEKGYKIKRLAVGPTPPEAVKDGIIVDPDDVAKEIRRLRKEAGINGKKVIITVNSQNILTRYMELPVMPEEELGEAVQWEAEQHFPTAMESTVIDYTYWLQENGEKYFVLVVGVQEGLVESYLDALELAGLKAAAIDIEPFCLLRAINQMNMAKEVAIVDFGASATKISIFSGTRLLFHRAVTIGGNHLTESIAESENIGFSEAERRKIEYGLSNEANTSFANILEELIREIGRSFDYFNSQYREMSLEKVYLTGGGSQLRGLPNRLEEEVGINTTRLGLLDIVADKKTNFQQHENMLTIGIGLGIRGVSFR
jgi:type IV pilus assembly protein PilM